MDNQILKCYSCGKQDQTVRTRTCGFAKEIYDEDKWEVICDDCEQEHCDDI